MWLKKKKEPDFIYEHEVLGTLRRFGLTITQTGNETDGYDPFDKFQLGTAFLHYGTLVDLMFHPKKYSGKGIVTFQNIKTKRHEVNLPTDYWIKAAKAIEVLEMNSHIKDDTTGGYMEITERKISLTKEGLIAFNTSHYIKEFKRDKYQDEIHASQLSTNFLMKLFTGILTISTVIALIFQINSSTSNKPTSIYNRTADSLIIEQVTTFKHIQETQNTMSSSVKELVDSLNKGSRTKK